MPLPPYPTTRREEIVDQYHGQAVADPYRWLENPDDPEVKAWIAKQNEVTESFLADIPERSAISTRLTKLWDFEQFGIPYREADRYFWTRKDGLQNQRVLYVLDSLQAEPRVLLDPNQLSADGTVALSGWEASRDGRLLAYGFSSAGSDWQEWRVRDVATGMDREDWLRWVKFSGVSWTPDHRGFYYSRYDEPADGKQDLTGLNYFQKLYYHQIGTPQANDTLIYHRPDQKEWGFSGTVTEDGRYLVISVWRGTDIKNAIFIKDLRRPESDVVELLPDFDAAYHYVYNNGPTFWFHTNLDSPKYRLITIDLEHPDRSKWQTIIPEQTTTLTAASVVGQHCICHYLQDARSAAQVYRLDGTLAYELALPGLGTASGFAGKSTDTETFYSFQSYTRPVTIYRLDVATGVSTIFREPNLLFDPDEYETTQVFVPSADGTKVPMFLTGRKGWQHQGMQPTLLYGYGGFNISLTPGFSASNLVWMEMGGVLAVANLRGGGEYGEAWHLAGMRHQKQNVFNDFLACAEWLQSQGITDRQKLAIHGGSNGGLLVGACMTQRPELFAAALPAVGVLDMLRFHKFTIGWAWVPEFGTAENPEDFPILLAYSPYHNLKPGTLYPATLITTADHDDRVVPAHSFKFAARLQEVQAGPAPVLIRIETKAGHGAGKPTTKIIEEVTDRWSFLVKVLQIQLPERFA